MEGGAWDGWRNSYLWEAFFEFLRVNLLLDGGIDFSLDFYEGK